jgi:ribose transport system permease protein
MSDTDLHRPDRVDISPAPTNSLIRDRPPARPLSRRRIPAALSFRRLSAVYILVALIILFSLWVPRTFLTFATWHSLLDNQALTALAAVGLTIPVAAGAFDLAMGAEIGFTSILVSWLLVDHGVSVPVSIGLTLLAGAAIGGVSALLVGFIKIDSFVATLGVQSVVLAMTEWLSGGTQILNLPAGFASFSTHKIFGVAAPVYIMLAVALVVWYVVEYTPLGRRIYATGGNEAAARLAGVRTRAVVAGAFVACGVVSAGVGVLLASQLGTGDPTSGPSYLLPAFSAVFLGSTQFRAGRFNVWGTILAVYVLGVGVTGFQLAGAPVWIPDLFNGLALILAVGLAKFEGRPNGWRSVATLFKARPTRRW